jgi:hypothetical protein
VTTTVLAKMNGRDGRLMISTAHKLISALVCDAEKNFVAAGIENPEDGPTSSPVYIWYIAIPLVYGLHQHH